MPPRYPVIGFDAWKSEPERIERTARRARIRFFAANFAKGIFWALMIAAAISLVLYLAGIRP